MKLVWLFALVSVCVVGVALCDLAEDIDHQLAEEHATHVEHHGRSKRSPIDPYVTPLIIGKSFLLGALLGPRFLRKRPHHIHIHGGWGWGGSGYAGGWGWSGPSHGWGWGWSG